ARRRARRLARVARGRAGGGIRVRAAIIRYRRQQRPDDRRDGGKPSCGRDLPPVGAAVDGSRRSEADAVRPVEPLHRKTQAPRLSAAGDSGGGWQAFHTPTGERAAGGPARPPPPPPPPRRAPPRPRAPPPPRG